MQSERMAEGEAFVPSLREYTELLRNRPEARSLRQVVMHRAP